LGQQLEVLFSQFLGRKATIGINGYDQACAIVVEEVEE
jgi:hypothetical protein